MKRRSGKRPRSLFWAAELSFKESSAHQRDDEVEADFNGKLYPHEGDKDNVCIGKAVCPDSANMKSIEGFGKAFMPGSVVYNPEYSILNRFNRSDCP
jgi:hypothetical protein